MDDMRDLMAPYLLDALDEHERRRFEAHLDDHPELADELATMRAGVEAMAGDAATTPPPSLRASVLGAIAGTPQETKERVTPARRVSAWRRWIAAGAVATAAVIAVVVGAMVGGGAITAEDVFAAGDLRTVTADVGATPARLDYSLDLAAAVVTFDGLPRVDATQTYELWVIDDEGATPAGLFRPESDVTRYLLDQPVAPGVTIGLTIEPSGGSQQPTGEILATWSVST